MVGKKFLISTSLTNQFGTLVIDQQVREWVTLIGFYHLFPPAEWRYFVFFSIGFQRARGRNYRIPKLSQNKMKRLKGTSNPINKKFIQGDYIFEKLNSPSFLGYFKLFP